MPHTGSCLCGQSTVTVETSFDEQIVCHCTDCQRTSGSAFSTNILSPKAGTTIEGPIKQFDMKAASGNTVTRIFCGNCGSALSHKSVAFGDAQAVQTGNLPDFANIPVKTELFTKSRWSGIPPIPGAAQFNTMPN